MYEIRVLMGSDDIHSEMMIHLLDLDHSGPSH
jgi:hypothetical protein